METIKGKMIEILQAAEDGNDTGATYKPAEKQLN